MSHEIENELKLLFAQESDFLAVRDAYPSLAPAERQINHYYEVEHRENPRRYALRIREEANTYELCLKVKTSQEGSQVTSSREYITPLNAEQFQSIQQEPLLLFPLLPTEAQHFLSPSGELPSAIRNPGSVTNIRDLRQGPAGFTYTFDLTTYPDASVTYELEIEHVRESDLPFLQADIQRHGRPTTPARKGKFQRFLDSIGRTRR